MANIKCLACGKRYDYYEHGCCPACGAYNRPPRRNRVDADGTVHHLSDSEFFNETAARSRQSGKVCFEREECHEDKVRRSASPFDVPPTQNKGKKNSAADGRKKLLKLVAIVVVLVNIVPLLLTMCSVSGIESFVEEFFSEEAARPEPLPFGDAAYSAFVGEPFTWWDRDAAVVDVTMDQQGMTTFLELTMWREEAYDEPVVYYDTVDGWQEKVGCENVIVIDNETFVYSYTLDNYQYGAECYAYFDGYNGNTYCEIMVQLAETPLDSGSVQVCTYTEVGVPFWWWDEEIWVDGADIIEDGSETEVWLTVRGDCEVDMPQFVYWDENGQRMWISCEEFWQQSDEWNYIFRVSDREPGTDCWALFGDDAGEVCVLLN